MKPNYCAPGRNHGFTCFSLDILYEMMRVLQELHPNDIKTKPTTWKKWTHKKLYQTIQKELQQHYQIKEDTEWEDLPFMDTYPKLKQMISHSLRPEMPEEWEDNPATWLNTDDIARVMKQYQVKFPDFMFFGPVASDCPDAYPCELSGFDCEKLLKGGIRRIGIIFNLDKHNQPGSHWVAVYASLPDGVVEYYDSYAVRAPKLIREFMERIAEQGKQNGFQMEVKNNTVRHQYGGSECGVFSMYYILQRLHGRTREETLHKKPTDDLMTQLRMHLYRPSKDLMPTAKKIVEDIQNKNSPNRGPNQGKTGGGTHHHINQKKKPTKSATPIYGLFNFKS
jgi:hypothetical protein